MNKTGARFVCVMMAVLLGVAACGNKQSAPAHEPAKTDAPAQTAGTAATPAAPAEQPPAAENAAPTATPPAETISETDDAGEETVADTTPSTTQPTLRLGGPASGPATSAQFKDGVNYVKVVPAQPTSAAPGKVEVLEIFWYGCGHCFALDPGVESWRTKTKPAYVEFTRIPAMWNDATRMHARVFYTAEVLGKLDELHSDIFRQIHVKGDPFNTVEKISAFFVSHGVSADDFQKAFASFAVESKLQRADFLNRRYRIDSVPTVIINGKYRTDVGMAGGEEQLFGLIGELVASEHGG